MVAALDAGDNAGEDRRHDRGHAPDGNDFDHGFLTSRRSSQLIRAATAANSSAHTRFIINGSSYPRVAATGDSLNAWAAATHAAGQDSASQACGGSASACLHPDAWRGPLEQDVAAEPEQLGGAATRAESVFARRLDQPAAFHQAAEVLLVQMRAEDRLDGLLQLKQREHRRHQLEDHGPVFDAAPELADGAGKHLGMIAERGMGKLRRPRSCNRMPDARHGTADEARLAQELVALEHLLLVPCRQSSQGK